MAEDEVGTIRTLTVYRDQIRVLVEQHRGRVVDAPGDNVLAEFSTALDAVECGVEIQRVIRARSAGLWRVLTLMEGENWISLPSS